MGLLNGAGAALLVPHIQERVPEASSGIAAGIFPATSTFRPDPNGERSTRPLGQPRTRGHQVGLALSQAVYRGGGQDLSGDSDLLGDVRRQIAKGSLLGGQPRLDLGDDPDQFLDAGRHGLGRNGAVLSIAGHDGAAGSASNSGGPSRPSARANLRRVSVTCSSAACSRSSERHCS